MSLLQLTPPWLQFLLWTSLQASLLALVLLVLMPALAKFVPARWRIALWLIVLVRFLPIPLPASPFTISHLWSEPAQVAATPSPAIFNVQPTPFSIPPELTLQEVPSIVDVPAVSPITASPGPTNPAAPITLAPAKPAWPALLSYIYFAGAALILLRLTLATLALRRMIRRSTPATDPTLLTILREVQATLHIRKPLPLLLSDTLYSPALVGMIQPRLILPRALAAQLDPAELRHVLLHECAHHCRRDVLLNYLLAALSIVHWFNPLVWHMLPRIRAERELATDECVLQHADPTAYGHTLLKLVEVARSPNITPQRPAPAAVGILESDRPLKQHSFFRRRIQMIAAFKNRSAWLAVPALLTLAAMAALTLPRAHAQVVAPPQSTATILQPSELPMVQPLLDQGVPQSSTTTALQVETSSTHHDAPNAATLEKPITVIFDGISLAEVLESLRQQSGINMVVNWESLRVVGVTRERKISLNLKDVPLRKALQLTLDLTATRGNPLTFTYDDQVLLIIAAQDLPTPRRGSSRNPTPVAVLQNTVDSMATKAVDVAAIMTNQKLAIAEQKLADFERQLRQSDPRLSSPFNAEADPTLQAFQQGRLALEQERVATMARTDSPAGVMKEIDARIEKVNQQMNERRDQLKQLEAQSMKEAINKRPDLKTEIYDVRGVAGVPVNFTGALNADQRAAVEELAATINKFVGRDGNVSTFNGQLIIAATDESQQRVREILDQLGRRQAEREERARTTPK